MSFEAEKNQPEKPVSGGMQLWGQLILADRAALSVLGRDLQILGSRFPELIAPLNGMLEKLVSHGIPEHFFGAFSAFAETITSKSFDTQHGQGALRAALAIIDLRGPDQADKILDIIKDIHPGKVKYLEAFALVQERLVQHYSKFPDAESAELIQNVLLERAISSGWMKRGLNRTLNRLLTDDATPVGNQARVTVLSARDNNYNKVYLNELKAISVFESRFSKMCRSVEQQRAILELVCLPDLVVGLENINGIGMAAGTVQRTLINIAGQIGKGTHFFESWFDEVLTHVSERPGLLASWTHRVSALERRGLSVGAAMVLERAGTFERSPAEETHDILLEYYGSNQPMNRLVESLALFVERAEQGITLFDQVLARLVSSTEFSMGFAEKHAKDAILRDELRFDKLVLCLSGKGLSDSESISSRAALFSLIIELEAQHDIYELLNSADPEQRESLNEIFVDRYLSDNPPFRLMTGEAGQPPASDEIQSQFMRQVFETFIRHEDSHFGFWANTYNFKHTPISRVCPIDEMAFRLGADVSVIPSTDIRLFPGPGRMIKNIDVGRVFFPDQIDEVDYDFSEWRNYYLKDYGPLDGYSERANLHPLDLVAKAKFTAFRAGMAVSVPKNRFINLDAESATLIDWNHHFDASGAQMATLVATSVFDSFFEPYLVPVEGASLASVRELARRITDQPPTMSALIARSREMGVFAPVNLSAGSAFSGGLTNGLPIRERNYYHWERPQDDFQDRFNRSHKWHIRNQDFLLERLHRHHEQIYKCTSALQNVRDLFKLIVGLDARGDTLDLQTKELNPYRMLEYFCTFAHEFSEKGLRGQAPGLALAEINYWAKAISSPFVFDGKTGYCFNAWDAPFEIQLDGNGQPADELRDWWEERVIPFLKQDSHAWIAPRLVDRENLLDQMELFGYRGK